MAGGWGFRTALCWLPRPIRSGRCKANPRKSREMKDDERPKKGSSPHARVRRAVIGLPQKGEHDPTLPELVATDLGAEGELRMVFKVPTKLPPPRGNK